MTFKVTLQPSEHTFDVENGESILEAAIRQNVGMPYGCRSGRCGACVSTLVAGDVDYADGQPKTLVGEDADKCAPCTCVPTSDVTLKVREVESSGEIEPRLLPCRVHQIDHVAHDVIRILLKLPEGQRLQFKAGQYLDFLLSDGKRRAFSIANAPHDDDFIELHIRHVDGGKFTDWAFGQMQEKAILRIQAPMGTFSLNDESKRPLLFIGGGTGFAPLKGQIEHAFERGITRPMTLFWGVRSKRDLYMPELPEQWAKDHPNFNFIPVLSEPDEDWTGRTGWVHEAVVSDIGDIKEHDIYMAGPPVMVKAGRDAFREAGVADDNMYYDSFEYAEDSKKK